MLSPQSVLDLEKVCFDFIGETDSAGLMYQSLQQ